MGSSEWDAVRDFALGLPAAEEDFPWGETVIKVRRKPGPPPWRKDKQGVYGPMFLWMGQRSVPAPAICVKLTGSYEEAVAVAEGRRPPSAGLASGAG